MLLSRDSVQKSAPPQDATPESAEIGASAKELQLVEALRHGEEAAFASLVNCYHGPLLRLATSYVRSREVAEEVVQDTWVAVLEGLDRFEGRSSLKTWIFRILINRAKTRGLRESRTMPFSSLGNPEDGSEEPAVDPERFLTKGPWVGHWASPPRSWDDDTPERLLLSKEGVDCIDKAIETLPLNQRQVILLHDVEELTPKEVCNLLGINEVNQRVLLHRARSKVRRNLEQYLDKSSSQA